jgi:hypothetical protein
MGNCERFTEFSGKERVEPMARHNVSKQEPRLTLHSLAHHQALIIVPSNKLTIYILFAITVEGGPRK